MWSALTKKRIGSDRFVVVGLAMAIVGALFGTWAVVVSGDSIPPLSVSFVIVGLAVAGVGWYLGSRNLG